MFKQYLLILLLGHILGDFYLQNVKMAQRKLYELRWVFYHGIQYCITMLIVTLPIVSLEAKGIAFILSVLHLGIDLVKYIALAKAKECSARTERNRKVFWMDQLLHLFCLFFGAYILATKGKDIILWKPLSDFLSITDLDGYELLRWVIVLLLIHKPANIAIQNMLSLYKPDGESDKKSNNAGRVIGTVERVIMLLFLSLQQYSALGLVLTAKSIARFEKISKEKDFAEYYLLGTLFSAVWVIVSSFIL